VSWSRWLATSRWNDMYALRVITRTLGGTFVVAAVLGAAGASGSSSYPDHVITPAPVISSLSPAIVLDANGYPVIATIAPTGGGEFYVVLYRCNDADCTGGDESVTTIESFWLPTFISSEAELALDASGNPILAYLKDAGGNRELRVIHCGNAACTSGNTIATAATIPTDPLGGEPSMLLDSSGNPVIGYTSGTDATLLHCNDAGCLGGDDVPVTLSTNGQSPAIALDSAGYPVVSFRWNYQELRVLHCGDANCSANNTLTTPDAGPAYGSDIRLNASGNPVISYAASGGSLGILRCNDPNCDGGDDITAVPFPEAVPYSLTSLALDPADKPVIAFAAGDSRVLLMRCGDLTCSSGNTLVRVATSVWQPGLTFDGSGQEVIAYGGILTVVRCGVPHCSTDTDGDGCSDVLERATPVGSETGGGVRDAKNPNDYFNPSHDKKNRVDDILLVVNQYFDDDNDGSPGLPPYVAGYNPDTDRTLLGPNAWNLGPPNGLQRVDDILNQVKQYFHDCV
jgi:hypothetical protein